MHQEPVGAQKRRRGVMKSKGVVSMSAITRPIKGSDPAINAGAAYRIIWRWHFYAGLFCLPFIVVLSLSGMVYLFKPQIDAFLDRALRPSHARRTREIARRPGRGGHDGEPGARLKAL